MPVTSDLLKYGLVGAAGLTAAGLAVPDEGESAVLPKAAVESAVRKLGNLGKKVSPEGVQNIEKWAYRNVPAELGTAKGFTDASDLKLLRAALGHPEFSTLPAEKINALRTSQAALPETVHSLIDPSIHLFSSHVPNTPKGQYFQRGDYTSAVAYNPNAIGPLELTPGHELGSHGATYNKNIRGVTPVDVNENLAKTRSIDAQVNLQRKQAKNSPILSTEGNRAVTDTELYWNMPGEIAARKMGDTVAEAVKTKEGIAAIRNDENYFKNLGQFSAEANAKSRLHNPKAWKEGMKNWKDYLAITGAGTGGALGYNLISPDKTYASHDQDMSNIDKTVMVEKSKVNPVKGLSPGVAEFFTGVGEGVRAVVKGVKGTAGEMYDTAKVAGKVLTGQLPGTKENLSKAQEAVNFVASFNPVVAGGQLLDEARSFFMPKLEKADPNKQYPIKLNAQGIPE